MKFFDLSLSGLGDMPSKEARYTGKDWLGNCKVGNYAGGSVRQVCENSPAKLKDADYFYREFLHGCTPANQDGIIYRTQSACR